MKFVRRLLLSVIVLAGFLPGRTHAAKEGEQLELETQIQQRIESILAKTLPPDSYLVTVKVEMESKITPVQRTTRSRRGAPTNPFLTQGNFMLPGVPQKKEFGSAPEPAPVDTDTNAFSAETLVRKILITILVAPDVTQDQIRAIRDFVSASVPFNPLRGDEMDIQNSQLLKKSATAPSESSSNAPASSDRPTSATSRAGSFFSVFADRGAMPLILLLSTVTVLLLLLLAFLFGPVRAFLNRLLAVLPRIGEQAAYTVSNSNPKGSASGTNAQGPAAANRAAGAQGNPNGNGSDSPFHFIREDQLNKIPILFRQMAPPQAALVLAYLPPEWASRVLGELAPGDQTAIMAELSQAREVPPEIVRDVETQVKNKLPYLVGGVDWIQSVYQFTQPQTQRALLGTLNQQDPELARQLRRRTFFFEDLGLINPPSLRLLAQEIGYPTLASAIRDEKPEFRDSVTRKLPPAMREIIQQELELSVDDRGASIEAKARLVVLARRLLQDGRISLPEQKR